VNQVCLVEIATGKNNIHPVNLVFKSQQIQDLLKPLNATKQLWR
jgi:hypothetical protein